MAEENLELTPSSGRRSRNGADPLPVLGALLATLLLMTLAVSQPNAGELPPLTLDDLFAQPSLFGTEPTRPLWSPDSAYLAFAWNDAGMPRRELWVIAPGDGAPRSLGAPPGDLPAPREFLWLRDSRTLVSLRGQELWSVHVEGTGHRLLGRLGPGASRLSLAPDRNALAYLRGGDLWLFDLKTGTSSALTAIGIASLSDLPAGRYSRPEREIGPGIWGGPDYEWSPDGRSIALHLVDRRGMRKVPFPDYLAPDTRPNEVRRGYPGDANEHRSVALLDVADRELRLLELPDPASNQIVGFAWSPANVLLVDVASDTAEDRWLYTVDRATAVPRRIWHSHRPTRIYTAFSSAWHPDGRRVLFVSDRGDRYGIYVIDSEAAPGEPRLLSDPGADVLGATSIGGDRIFFTSNGHRLEERHVYYLESGLDSAADTAPGTAGKPRRLTTLKGQNIPYPAPDGRHLAVMHSNDAHPPELYLLDTAGGTRRRVTRSPLAGFREREWARGRYLSFPSAIDDYQLRARLLLPADFDPQRRYPVLFGPVYSNTARNRWAGVYSRVQQLLVQKGYLVVQVDVRGSTGYGRAFREEFLVDFAGDDLEDIASAVAYVSSLPYVDADRLGIWGSSYGGTLSVYSLLKKPGLFRAAAAAAAAVDPRSFGTDDVAIVRRPDTHPRIFENTAERYAANLQDHLLIIHGMQDQVVPFRSTAVLAEALMREGKDFEFAFAAGATHGWSREAPYARYLFGRMLGHFDRYLQPDMTTQPGPAAGE